MRISQLIPERLKARVNSAGQVRASPACLTQKLITEFADKSYFFSNSDEQFRRYPPERVIFPTRERLETDNTIALKTRRQADNMERFL